MSQGGIVAIIGRKQTAMQLEPFFAEAFINHLPESLEDADEIAVNLRYAYIAAVAESRRDSQLLQEMIYLSLNRTYNYESICLYTSVIVNYRSKGEIGTIAD